MPPGPGRRHSGAPPREPSLRGVTEAACPRPQTEEARQVGPALAKPRDRPSGQASTGRRSAHSPRRLRPSRPRQRRPAACSDRRAFAPLPSKQATDPCRNRKTRHSRRDPEPCGFPADPGRGGPERILALGTDGHMSSLANRGRQASADRPGAIGIALRTHRRQINAVCGGSGPASAPMRSPAGVGPAPQFARRRISRARVRP